MCGLAGVIFGNKRRRAEEREYLAWLFTRLLLLSEERGPHATGAAWLDTDGGHRLFKRPVTAERFVTDKAFAELLAGINNRATLLLGHTRWRTRGDERVNSNNHPIRAGEVIGTHNGTIYNADYLFRRWKMRRFAEVDRRFCSAWPRTPPGTGPWISSGSRRASGAAGVRSPPSSPAGPTRAPSLCSRGTGRWNCAGIPAAKRFSTRRTRRTSTPCWRRKKAGVRLRSRP